VIDIELGILVLFVFSPFVVCGLYELAKGLRWMLRRRADER